jgi:membrane-bound lytic murein transglycosylase C
MAKYSFRVSLVSNYTKKLAEKYLPLIEKYCYKNNISVPLVLSIIHSESCFNPHALSPAGAMGLMQLMPQYGAKEAAEILHKSYSHEDLYKPELNIEFGITYMHKLLNTEFGYLNDYLKIRHCAIAAYNCGPNRFNAQIKKIAGSKISEKELYSYIKNLVPNETKHYLVDSVTQRIDGYKKWFNNKKHKNNLGG